MTWLIPCSKVGCTGRDKTRECRWSTGILLGRNQEDSRFLLETSVKRFWDKVDKAPGQGPSGTCWEWQASTDTSGYGWFWFQGRPRGAHRVLWILTYGKIPEGTCVCHHCDNPRCVNPDHLFLGTNADNVADRDRKGRQGRNGLMGESHGRSKLTEREVVIIRRLYQPGRVSQEQLAKRLGVSQSQISLIVSRKCWGHV